MKITFVTLLTDVLVLKCATQAQDNNNNNNNTYSNIKGKVSSVEAYHYRNKDLEAWKEHLIKGNYDHTKLGLKHNCTFDLEDKNTFDTSKLDHNNIGHYTVGHPFEEDRGASSEYRKSI